MLWSTHSNEASSCVTVYLEARHARPCSMMCHSLFGQLQTEVLLERDATLSSSEKRSLSATQSWNLGGVVAKEARESSQKDETMKRTIDTSRHHCRDNSISSLESNESFILRLSEDEETPEHSNAQRRRLSGPEMVAILASSSPEIQALCKKLPLEQQPSFHFHSSISKSSNSSLENNGSKEKHDTHTPFWTSTEAVSTTANRVSMSPPLANNRSPLQDVTGEITASLSNIRLYPSPRKLDRQESNKENIPPPLTPQEAKTTISPTHPPKPERPTLHRRVSFDMLPSPSEISSPHRTLHHANSTGHLMSKRRRPRHRRNTTQIVVPPQS